MLALIILVQFVGLLFACFGFFDLANKVSFAEGQFHETLVEGSRNTTTDNYDIVQFMKDLYVYAGLYGDYTVVFLLISIVSMIVYLVCLLKSRMRKQSVQL